MGRLALVAAALALAGCFLPPRPAAAHPGPTPLPSPAPVPTLDPFATAVPAPLATQWAITPPGGAIAPPGGTIAPPSGTPAPPTATPEAESLGESISRAFYTILFPVESMEDALRGVFSHFLSGSLAAAESVFAEAVEAIVLQAPDDALADYRAPWAAVLRISAALWPLTFVIVLTGAARESLIRSAPVTFADTKQGLLDWLIAAVLAAASLLILSWVNQLFQEITRAILAADFGLFEALDARAIAGTLLNAGLLGGFTALVPLGGLFIAFLFIILALSVLISLFLVYVAQHALRFVLVVVAPLVLTLSVLPPTRWLNWSWMRMVLLVSLLGPVNALLLKLASLATIQQAGAMGELSLVPAVVHFFKLVGVLSLLLTVNFTVAKTTFGAVNEVKDRAVGATKQVAGMIVTAVAVGATALAGAAIGGAAIGGVAGGGGGLAGGGGAAAAGAGGAATSAPAHAGSQVPANAGASAMRAATAQMGNQAGAVTPSSSQTPGDGEAQTSVEERGAGVVPGTHGGAVPGTHGGAVPGTRGGAVPGIREEQDAGNDQNSQGTTDGSGEQDAGPRHARGGERPARSTPSAVQRAAGPGSPLDWAGALQVGGATLSAMSHSRLGRGVGTAARVGGWMMERQMDREAHSRPGDKPAGPSAFRTGRTNIWQGMAAGLGASSPAGYAAVTDPLSRLEAQYGFDAARSAAQESLGPAIAARRFGNETAPSMAMQDGFFTRGPEGQPQADVSAWIGSTVENRLRTMPGGAHTGPRLYPAAPPSAPAAPGGAGPAPSLLDFRQGAQMAEALGYGRHDQEAVRALASLHHVHRNPRLGFDAGSARATVEAAWRARSAPAGAIRPDGELARETLPAVRAAFLHDVSQIARDHGHTDEFIYPTPWSTLSARMRAGAEGAVPANAGND